ncbi:MAG: LPS assembly lipoprotein LptE [Campylobacterales bacterium]
MRQLIVLGMVLLLAGCGYKPSSYYSKRVLGDAIFADVQIPMNDPQSGGILLDALNEAIVAKFGGKLTSREASDTQIFIREAKHSVSALQRDKDGFVILYRSHVTMTTQVNSPATRGQVFSVSGSYDFAVEPSSVLSDSARSTAAREAALKALDELLARLVLMGR